MAGGCEAPGDAWLVAGGVRNGEETGDGDGGTGVR